MNKNAWQDGWDAFLNGKSINSFEGENPEEERDFHRGWMDSEQQYFDQMESYRYTSQLEYEWFREYQEEIGNNDYGEY